MKLKFLYHILFAVSILTMSACTEDESGDDDNLPAGSLPSAEFKPNNLPDEPYAEDAIRVEAQDEQAPFYAIELMPNGHYLLSTNPYNYASSVRVATKADGSFSISKKHNNRTVRARSTRADDGSITFNSGESYGKFTKLGNKKYQLENGVEIDLTGITGSDKKITYKNYDGSVSNVYVKVSEPILDAATKSLCRTWNNNSFEIWGYWNNSCIAHGKQTLDNGKVHSDFKAIGGNLFDFDREDFLDDDNEFCEKVIFTSMGTYICFYLNGSVGIARWQWVDKAQGTLHYEDSKDDEYYDEEYDGYVTIRFAGNQMRAYEDYVEKSEGENFRTVAVNTLTAAN